MNVFLGIPKKERFNDRTPLHSLLPLITMGILLAGTFVYAADNSPTISEGQTTSPYDQMQTREEQVSAQPQEMTEVIEQAQQPADTGGEGADEMTAFDPSTIPDSIPDADYIFEVPVDVTHISPQIKEICVFCQLFELMPKDHNVQLRLYFGDAKKIIPLTNGAFQGNVIVGVNNNNPDGVSLAGKLFKASKYRCWISLVGPDGKYEEPSKSQVRPLFRMMDPDKPFNIDTVKRLP